MKGTTHIAEVDQSYNCLPCSLAVKGTTHLAIEQTTTITAATATTATTTPGS